MAEIIRMPKMSDTMTEGVIAAWHNKVGDQIKSGDIVAEVETDKATMDLEAYDEGTILYIGAQVGDAVPIDAILYIVGEKGEDFEALLQGGTPATTPPAPEAVPVASSPAIDTSNINARVELMPKMSDTMTEGVVVSWLKNVGDKISSGDLLAEIETDKATMELEAYDDGTLLYIGAKVGEAVAVDDVLYIVGEEGANFQALLDAKSNGSSVSTQDDTPSPVQDVPTASADAVPTTNDGGRIKISPLAKKMAADLGYDITQIKGTGEHGRIVKRDIEAYNPASSPATTKPTPATSQAQGGHFIGESYEEVKVSQMRKTIARRLAESKFQSPHFYLTMEINMDKAIKARKEMNEYSPVKISFNDIVIKATAAALKQHPNINSSWLEDKIRINEHVHIGVAVAVDEGLLVPVIRFSDLKSLSQIAGEVRSLAKKAKSKELQPQDWEGNTFTISNLGMFGIDEFTAIINPPDACILAVGGIKQTVIVKDGEMVIGNIMKVTLSCDHRVVDGAMGAEFLQTLKGYLEDPIRILV